MFCARVLALSEIFRLMNKKNMTDGNGGAANGGAALPQGQKINLAQKNTEAKTEKAAGGGCCK